MAELTRRGFIKNTSAGAAAVGAIAVAPSLAAAHPLLGKQEADLHAGALRGALAAHVADVTKGEITLLVGTREIVVHDSDLVMRLVKAAQ